MAEALPLTSPANNVPLGTADWIDTDTAREQFAFDPEARVKQIWMGEALNVSPPAPLGYGDDRHVTLVSGPRGGKGTSVIIPTLCLWPGSCVVIDPKGENAAVTAERRGAGSAYAHGMGQRVYNLDPFDEAKLDPALKARFNPLDIIDPASDCAIDDAGQIAAAIVVNENKTDPYWEDAARNLIKGLILFVLTEEIFEGRRNLVTVRRLLRQGYWLGIEALQKDGDKNIPPPFKFLWTSMQQCSEFGGVIAGVGEEFLSMSEKQRSSILSVAKVNTDFIDSTPIQRVLETSDFSMADLKTSPKGITLYLTLPRRYKEHYRWLRLMVSLAVGEMERVKGKPKTGVPTLFMLDEFAGLKRMEIVEQAAAQAAGFGVKFCFVVQTLAQLKDVYQDAWETFIGYSGLKLFFQVDDHFTREYVSKLIGEQELVRETQSGSESNSDAISITTGDNFTTNSGDSTTTTIGNSSGVSKKPYLLGLLSEKTYNTGDSFSRATTNTSGTSHGTSSSRSKTTSTATTEGWSSGLHKRLLLTPDEIGRYFSRIDDEKHGAFPGLGLALITGQQPLRIRRVNYFSSSYFDGLYGPHPDYDPPPTLAERAMLEEMKAVLALSSPQPAPAPDTTIPPEIREVPPSFSWQDFLEKHPLLISVAALAVCILVPSLVITFQRNYPSSAPISSSNIEPAPSAAKANESGRQEVPTLPSWCSNAKTTVEHLICGTPALATAELAMNEYLSLANRNGWANEIRQQRPGWLRGRDACGNLRETNDQSECVLKSYANWVGILKRYAETMHPAPPSAAVASSAKKCAILNGERICD